MEYKDITNKKATELNNMLSEARAQLYELRLKRSVNQLKDLRSIKKLRKDIARMLTRLSAIEREEVQNAKN